MSPTPDPNKLPGLHAPAKHPATPLASQPADAEDELPVSPGDNPLSVTPKDVTPGDASARDLMARHLDSSDPDEKLQALLDDAIDLSFPASDPPASAGGITRIEKPRQPSRP